MSRQEDTALKKNIRIAVLGSKSVGKTHLIKKIIGASYEEYIPSHSTTFQVKNIESKDVEIKYYDFQPVSSINIKELNQYQQFDVVINLFKDSQSFQEIYNFWQQIKSIEQKERQFNESEQKSHFSAHLKYVINIFKKQQQQSVQIQYDQIFEYLMKQINELKIVRFLNIIFDQNQDPSFSQLIAQIQSNQILDTCSWTYAYEDESNDQKIINLNLERDVIEQKSLQKQLIAETKAEQIQVSSLDILTQNIQQLGANLDSVQENTTKIQQKQIIAEYKEQKQHEGIEKNFNQQTEQKQENNIERHTIEQVKLQNLDIQAKQNQIKQFAPQHLEREQVQNDECQVQNINKPKDMLKQPLDKFQQKQEIVHQKQLANQIQQELKNEDQIITKNVPNKQFPVQRSERQDKARQISGKKKPLSHINSSYQENKLQKKQQANPSCKCIIM